MKYPRFLVILAVIFLVGNTCVAEPVRPAKTPELLLAGDAGALSDEGKAVLVRYLPYVAPGTVLVFMGDNIYPRGIPAPDKEDYDQSIHLLMRQIELAKTYKVKTIFVPGNHDWYNSNEDGLNAVKRQQEIVERELGAGSFAPRNGCPGPVVAHADSNFEVIALDTQWWMHKHEKPDGPEDGCETYSDDTVIAKLRELLSKPKGERLRVIVQHHPFKSVGPNGYGSRRGQAHHWRYKEMREKITAVLKEFPVDICAAGHEHSLQIGEGVTPGCRYSIVSGSLTYAQNLTGKEDKLTITGEPGFFSVTAPGPGIRMVK